jgi:molecular chaperone DnaJ
MRLAQTCPKCGGAGTVIASPCPDCGGEGRKKVRRNIQVRIPPGVETGSSLRVRGEGESGPAGTGDLYVIIEVLPHPVFSRENNNLVSKDDGLNQAVLGGLVESTLGGVKMKIPAGTQPRRPSVEGGDQTSRQRRGRQPGRVKVGSQRASPQSRLKLMEGSRGFRARNEGTKHAMNDGGYSWITR